MVKRSRKYYCCNTAKNPVLARKMMWQHLENVKQKLFELSDLDDPNFDGYLFNVSPLAADF